MGEIKEIEYKRDLKKFVYSIRITKEQRQLLKNNLDVKKELDRIVLEYLNIYLE